MQMGRCCHCSCAVKWTPNDETDRQIQITGSVTILNNPIMEEAPAPFAMALDALPTGPIAMAGGVANFGPDTADQGLGYYGLNSQNIRLQRFCTWDPPLESFELASPAGTYTFDSDTGHPYGFPDATVPPTVFMPTKSGSNCVWNGATRVHVYNVQTQLIGDAPADPTTLDVVFDRVCMKAGYPICDKIRVWTGGSGTRRAVVYNSAIGYLPTAILGVPLSSFDFSLVNYPGGPDPTIQTTTSFRDHLSGRSLGDGTAASYSNDFNSSSRAVDYRVRQRVFPDTTGLYTNTNAIDVGRTVLSSVVIGAQPKFNDGNWIVEVTPRLEFMTIYRHYYTASVASVTWDYVDEALYPPNVFTPNTETLTGDYSDFSNTDPEKGVFAFYYGIPSGMADGTHDIGPLYADDLVSLTPFKFTSPCWVGTETVTYDLEPFSIGHDGFAASGYVDASERYDGEYDQLLIRNSTAGNVGNVFGISVKPSAPGYTKTLTSEEWTAYRTATDPVVITLVEDASGTETGVTANSFDFSVMSGLTVAVPGTSPTFSVDYDDPGPGELTRKVI